MTKDPRSTAKAEVAVSAMASAALVATVPCRIAEQVPEYREIVMAVPSCDDKHKWQWVAREHDMTREVMASQHRVMI